MGIDERRQFLDMFEVHLRHQSTHHPRCVTCRQGGSKVIDGSHHQVGVCLRRITILEQGEDTAGARDVLIDLHRVLLLTAQRQEVGDILLETQLQHGDRQQQRHDDEREETQSSVPPHHIVDLQNQCRHLFPQINLFLYLFTFLPFYPFTSECPATGLLQNSCGTSAYDG